MHISWSFLDKRKATISAIGAFSSMDFIIRHTDEDITRLRVQMEGVSSPRFDSIPHEHNPHATEERLLNCMEEIDTLKERYRQAVEYMNWFKPAWNQLSEDEQYLLEVFYMDADECGNGIGLIEDRFGIEKTSAYNRKNRALDHLKVLLYGNA